MLIQGDAAVAMDDGSQVEISWLDDYLTLGVHIQQGKFAICQSPITLDRPRLRELHELLGRIITQQDLCEEAQAA